MSSASATLPTAQLWIEGTPRQSTTKKTYDVVNGGSQQVVGHAAAASSEDAIAAILAADKAQPAWEALPPRAKRAVFTKAAALIETPKYQQSIIAAMQQEISAGEMMAMANIMLSKSFFMDAAAMTTQLLGQTTQSDLLPGATVLVEKRALGTVLAMAPFNAPTGLVARAVVIPLACGNAVVAKSSEFAPRCAEIIVELLYEAGLPKGVLSLLHVSREDSPKVTEQIISHELIRHVNFTGGDRVGEIIATTAAKYLKPCVLELGGKSAVVVLNDCDVMETAKGIIMGAVANSGQVCMSTERVIVQREVSVPLLQTLTAIASTMKAGTEPTCPLAPLVTAAAAKRVAALLADAKERGGKLLVGDLTAQGAVLQPHIISDVEEDWPIWNQETFGPVFVVRVVDTEEEAISLANKTSYTLAGAIWTRNMDKGLKLARRIRASHVVVNAMTIAFESELGSHGLGGKSGYGRFDIDNFTQRRTVVLVSPAAASDGVYGLA
ncbi:aldehyde dehydrogenase [Hysterangium stoloniferum]|nr:aldehyde dehydrogenase [Hysterangium stoloniferum]